MHSTYQPHTPAAAAINIHASLQLAMQALSSSCRRGITMTTPAHRGDTRERELSAASGGAPSLLTVSAAHPPTGVNRSGSCP
mmetsp:Transcript_31516/g.62984  ORF Transcript_31516/g.62984 Transcript_31516/m.62984 type:complete len:82 (-) Transcript_31516:633-878(-)